MVFEDFEGHQKPHSGDCRVSFRYHKGTKRGQNGPKRAKNGHFGVILALLGSFWGSAVHTMCTNGSQRGYTGLWGFGILMVLVGPEIPDPQNNQKMVIFSDF